MPRKCLRVIEFVAAMALLSLPMLCHAASTEKVLFDLPKCTSGTCPSEPATADRGLTFDKSGNLYGVYQFAGASGSKCEGYGCGFVFKLTPKSGTWTESVLYNFCSVTNCADGAIPSSALAIDSAGNLYGTTWYGGSTISACGGLGCGVVYKLTAGSGGKWTETVLFSFNGAAAGAEPEGTTPIFDGKGNLYGTTGLGGAHNYGAVFELTPTTSGFWKETVLHSFNLVDTDGILPIGLVFDTTGNLYGATGGGGKYTGPDCVNTRISEPHCGTVYRLAPTKTVAWTETILHNFDDNGTDGYSPLTGVILDVEGNIYGTTEVGGKNNFGVVYELAHGTFAETFPLLFDTLGANSTGSAPLAGLTLGSSGNLYGTTLEGGTAGCAGAGCGTVFELSLVAGKWTETALYKFPSGNDGSLPITAVVRDSSGNLYGTASAGGTHDNGIIYEVIP